MRSIAAETLTLEPQAAAHAAEMFAVLGDPAIYEYENAPPASLEWLRARFEKLESRRSADGREQWLNWVIRVPGTGLVGYVQATVRADKSAGIAYELASAHWGKGLARQAVAAMMRELAAAYGVTRLTAVAKRANLRSTRLLERLGFTSGSEQMRARLGVEADEVLMVRAGEHCADVFRSDEGFEIRRAVEADRGALEALYRDCRRDARWLPDWRSRATFAEVSRGEAVYVAVGAAGRLQGMVSVWEDDPFVHHLYVREASRRSGVAGALLGHLVGSLAFPWRLKCMSANVEALDFYAKRGWKRIGEGVGDEGEYVELQLDRACASIAP